MSKKIAVSCDEYGSLVDVLLGALRDRGYDPLYFGPGQKDEAQDWPIVTERAIACLQDGRCSEAIVMCWTGTGCAIVANKLPGIRAALCHDAATARGARIWNHANVLALSMRVTSEPVLKEILDAWFDTPYSDDAWNKAQIARVALLDKQRGADHSRADSSS